MQFPKITMHKEDIPYVIAFLVTIPLLAAALKWFILTPIAILPSLYLMFRNKRLIFENFRLKKIDAAQSALIEIRDILKERLK